jgi:hypothetical protein
MKSENSELVCPVALGDGALKRGDSKPIPVDWLLINVASHAQNPRKNHFARSKGRNSIITIRLNARSKAAKHLILYINNSLIFYLN